MQKVRKTVAAIAVLVSLSVAVPASAAPRDTAARGVRRLIERIVRILDGDIIKYSLPPG